VQRNGQHTTPGNEKFDAMIRSARPDWGVKDVESQMVPSLFLLAVVVVMMVVVVCVYVRACVCLVVVVVVVYMHACIWMCLFTTEASWARSQPSAMPDMSFLVRSIDFLGLSLTMDNR
jgi:hypothetical protein